MSETAYARQRRDTRTADETDDERGLQCIAYGCPNRWSVDAGKGRLCSAHAWADAMQWPLISQQQTDAETERAFRAQTPKRPAPPVTHEQKLAIAQRLRDVLAQPANPREWAYRLRDRENAGEKLTRAQRECWRAAIRHQPEEQE